MNVETALVLHREDNVAVALRALDAGTQIDANGQQVHVLTPVPAGHKVAIRNFACGALVVQRWETLMWQFQAPTPWTPSGQKWIAMSRIFDLAHQ